MRAGLVIGATHHAQREVREQHTVPYAVPGCDWLQQHGLPVLSSAALLGLVEDVVFSVVTPLLEPEECLVGARHRWPHEAPAVPGERLQIAATCTRIHGGALNWRIDVVARDRRVAHFRHRAVVMQRAEVERRIAALHTLG